jgi:hypothetical protein
MYLFLVYIHLIEKRFIEILTYRIFEVIEILGDRNINI